MDYLKASPREHEWLGLLSDALSFGKQKLNNVNVPYVGGLGGLLLGQSPEMLNDLSYGKSPFTGGNVATGGIGTFGVDPRMIDVAGLVPTGIGAVKAGSSLAKTASKEALQQIESGTGLLGKNIVKTKETIVPIDIAKTLLGKTEQELAHEVAQKNAVKMLGLPEGNTAMDRANAMGYTEPLYRGSSAVETKLIPSSGHEHGVIGISTTPNPAYASLHGNNVMPLLGKKVNTSDYFDLVNQFENQTGKDFYDVSEKQFTNFLKKNNIGASTATDFLQPVDDALDIRYLNPQDVRSRFAAFDPARINENDILAGVMALPVSGLLQEPKEKKKKK